MKVILVFIGIVFIGFVALQIFATNEQKNIESYNYVLDSKYDSFEIRDYEASLFTTVQLTESNYKDASGKGFSILAGYIFGGNKKNEKIAMTSPVAMSLQDSIKMMFLVPKKYNKESLPIPNQTQIIFEEIPAKRVAAIRFGGWANDEKIEQYKQKLISELEKEGITHSNKFYFLGYNAPYDFINRKNDIIVEL